MIYIFTASYHEASAWIGYFHLKKDARQTRFQTFYSENMDICLTVTGSGMISAAAAVSSICTANGAGKGDFLIHTGSCAAVGAARAAVGDLFYCHKITELTTGKTFYPDVLYRHDFCEAALVTGAKPYDVSEVSHTSALLLYDGEAAAVYQAGSYFFAPHQMAFLKIVSDCREAAAVTPEQVRRLTDPHMGALAGYVKMLYEIGQKERQSDPVPEALLKQLCRDLYCSASMEASLRQHIRYCILAGIDYEGRILEMYRKNRLSCRNKREGKRCFEELKRRLL
ncbi:MAG: hypothetical protein HFJ05_01835 [Eubacterium sp.]|nr:hypothetical protein [Eubacterium sp.]